METCNFTDYLEIVEAQEECASTSLQASETDLHCDPTFTEKIKKEYSSPSLLRLRLKRKKSSKSLTQQHRTSETSEPNIYEQTRERLTPLKFMKRVAFILCLGTKHVPHSPKGEIFFLNLVDCQKKFIKIWIFSGVF